MRRKRLAAVCAVALLLLALPVTWVSGSETEVIFTAANYTLQQPLSNDTMPFKVKGTVYVPYTLFDASTNGGVNLGVFNGGQDKSKGTYTMYSRERNLTFDLNTGLAYEYYPDGQLLDMPGAVIRYGTVFVPAARVGDYFGLDTFQTYVTLGEKSYLLLRVKNDNPGLDDSRFVDSAISSMTIMLNNYFRSLNPQSTPNPNPTTGTPPSPTVSPSQEPDRGVRTYLAVRCDTGESLSVVLDKLNAEGRSALLLLPPERLVEEDDLVRRAVSQGHVIGLLVPGQTADAAQEAARKGNLLLERIALTTTRILLADGADAAVTEALNNEGYFCWQGNIDGVPAGRSWSGTAAAVTRGMEGRENVVRITMDDSTASSLALTRILRAIREEGYDYRTAVETEF